MNNQQHENRMLTLEHLNLAWKLLQKSKILPANYLFKQLLLHEPQKERQRKMNMLFISFWKRDILHLQQKRYCIFKITNLYTIILNYYQDKRRSICRSTVVSESDPRANGTRCFGLFDVS
ncbi:hypothetical protein T10_10527 [Trichinella papuae]|uniref:Uncharacterized protein n=1 Tax=Trichinella papuae TaxID=268474 RepID=A0A0V1MYX4_9BILA|nr:hypothetical protein T10_10527 [Trichinella papuae]